MSALNAIYETVGDLQDDLLQAALVQNNLTLVKEIGRKADLDQGLEWKDVAGILGKLVPELMDVATTFKELEGQAKREFVVDCLWVLYKTIDPNIPWIPEPMETKLERLVVTRLGEAAVEAAYTLGKMVGRF